MESFPDLKDYEVALIRAEKHTGHVLDEKLSLALLDKQEVYTVFESLNKAQNYAKEILSSNQEIEIVIYSSTHKVLFYSNCST